MGCSSQSVNFKNEVEKYLIKYKRINNYEHFLSKLFELESKQIREDRITKLFIEANKKPEEYQAIFSGIDKNTTRDLIRTFHSIFGDSNNFSLFQNVVLSNNDKNIGLKLEDFTFTDKLGNRINISDFRGKLLIIDFWATWCKPCLELEDDYKKVIEKFQNNKNIQFLSIAVRQSQEPWLNHIEEDEYKNLIHGRFENKSDFQVPLGIFNLLSIPKFAFINKNQEIIYSNGPQPDCQYFQDLIIDNFNE